MYVFVILLVVLMLIIVYFIKEWVFVVLDSIVILK